MDELKPCPFCGRELVRTVNTYKNSRGTEVAEDYYMHDVTASPEWCPAEEICIGNNAKDITAWNTRTQPNPPLTPDELRGMDGEPVWVETMQEWRMVNVDCENGFVRLYTVFNTISAEHVFNNDGRIYRHKPKEG